jgi:hypothetical protein
LLFEALAKLTRSRSHFRSAVRYGVLVYLAVCLGAGAALHSIHVESSKHGHRYCPEHEQIEVVEPEGGADSDAYAGQGYSNDASVPAVQGDERVGAPIHVACAFLNGLFSRTTATPNTHGVVTVNTDDSKLAIALSERIAAFDSVLFVAPKTSPPPVAA